MIETLVKVLVGVVIGIILDIIYNSYQREGDQMKKKPGREEEAGFQRNHDRLCAIECLLEAIVVQNNKLSRQFFNQGDDIMKTLDEVVEKVRESNTIDKSLIALTRGMKKKLDDIIAGGLPPAQQAKVDALFAEVEQGQKEVADAILENTESEPEVPPQ